MTVDQLMYTCIIKALNKTLWLINALFARQCFFILYSVDGTALCAIKLSLALNLSFLLDNSFLTAGISH